MRENSPSLNDRLALISLIDQGMRLSGSDSPIMADLFSDLWSLVNGTVSGSKIDLLKHEDSRNGFKVFEANAETGENLGYLNMLYMNKPIPSYYLVYVEVAPPFRKKGLGNRILKYFKEFLTDKSAVGILDNIIPEEDATYDIYSKHGWDPVEKIIGNDPSSAHGNYMIYVPPGFKNRELRQSLIKLLYHLKRKRAAIDMRDNEVMVQRTIAEFKGLYSSLTTYFQTEMSRGEFSPLMRFMFTRFVTKFIAFRRRISELIGYTGGESLEQINLSPEVEALPMQSYASYGPAAQSSLAMGDETLWSHLPDDLKKQPARTIDAFPNYQRPSLRAWLKERGIASNHKLTLGDLMDIGFDPTRLKEFCIDGEEFIFERIQVRQVQDLEKKKELLGEIERNMSGSKVNNTWLKVNPPLLVIQDSVNAYVLRRKVGGIHWEEAVEQLQTDSALKTVNASVGVEGKISSVVRKTRKMVAERLDIEEQVVKDYLTCFLSWDINANHPKLVIDFTNAYFESIWLA
jgi:hypothetical protein